MDASDRGSIVLVRNAKAMPMNPTCRSSTNRRFVCALLSARSDKIVDRFSTPINAARSCLLRSHFHFVSEIWHEVVPHANATSPYGAFDPVFPGEEHLSCSGRLLLSRGVAANVIDYRRGFWRYRYCRKLGRKHGKSVDAGGRFRLPLFRVETLAQACPRCGSPVTRVHRHPFDRVISLIYPVRRYRCRTCPWEGLLKFRIQ